MKFRLPLIVLCLVVVPTAILSFLAGQSLKHDQILAQERMETSARNAVRMATRSISSRLDDHLAAVQSALREVFFAGGQRQQMRRAADRLESTSLLIDRIYLFMNPWEFMWPEDAEGDESVGRQRLVGTLRAKVATDASSQGRIAFRLSETAYIFRELGGRRQYYGGFRVNPDGLAEEIARAIADAAGGGIMLGVEGGGLSLSSGEPDGTVLVVDSFGERSEIGGTLSLGDEHVLASEFLPPPFEETVVVAYLEDPLELEQLGAMRAGLQRWGIFLLAAGVLAGVWLMIGTAQAEIRRAQSGTEFAIGVSHDLRTPIASMKVLAESMYLDRVEDSAKRKAFLATIINECDRLGLLIERVLYLVRFGQDAIQYNLQEADIETAVNNGVGEFRARFSDVNAAGCGQSNQPAINVDIEPELPRIRIDSSAFTQVLVNLLDNAVKYGRLEAAEGDGANPPLITVSARRERRRRRRWDAERNWVRLDVNDRGEGMDRDELRRVFRRFYRSERAGQLNLSGVGLGLSVCKHAAEAHGGWIEVESEKGKGTTFAVFFPVADAAAG